MSAAKEVVYGYVDGEIRPIAVKGAEGVVTNFEYGYFEDDPTPHIVGTKDDASAAALKALKAHAETDPFFKCLLTLTAKHANALEKVAPLLEHFATLVADVQRLERFVSVLQQKAAKTFADYYQGVWRADAQYQRGDLSTTDGGLWLSLRDGNTRRPGSDREHWKLVAKGGRE